MNGLIQRLAAASDMTPAQAADELDRIVHRLVVRLRNGQPATLRGLGKFTPGVQTSFQPEIDNERARRNPRANR